MTAEYVPLEISAYLIGGPRLFPKKYRPQVITMPMTAGGAGYAQLPGWENAALCVYPEIRDVQPLSGGWASARISLRDPNGYDIGRRPAMFYTRPWDTPAFTSFYYAPEDCTFVVGIRRHS